VDLAIALISRDRIFENPICSSILDRYFMDDSSLSALVMRRDLG
jgi:hypothetical protein